MFPQAAVVFLCVVISVSGQGAVSFSVNHDGSSSLGAKVPVVGTGTNQLSLTAGTSSLGAFSKGLTLDNAAGHSLSVSQNTIPNFGSQLTASGNLNLLTNPSHKLDANAFITRNMPDIASVPNFNTVGGGLDYTFRNKVGASVGLVNTPYQQRTDYSALGKFNLHQSPQSSFDLSAGFSKSVSPQLNTGWQPTAGLTFTKIFGGISGGSHKLSESIFDTAILDSNSQQ